jgi:hypothetical protein
MVHEPRMDARLAGRLIQKKQQVEARHFLSNFTWRNHQYPLLPVEPVCVQSTRSW